MSHLYRAVWRWHFYAGLLVLPFLAWLAVTGALYLYKAEIERNFYGSWMVASPHAAAPKIAPLLNAVTSATGGTVTQIVKPASGGEAWRMNLTLADGQKRMAFVDPADGRVLGMTRPGGIMGLVKDLHSLAITGPVGNALIEIAAGWAIILVLTGFYLWWPRRGSPIVGLRGAPGQRLFWRDLHASLGLVAGGIVLFLAVTGMPWSGVWGKNVQAWVTSHSLGKPKAPAAAGAGGEHAGHEGMAAMPWAMQKMMMPMDHKTGPAIGPDRAITAAQAAGLSGAWTLTLPAAPGKPYLFSVTARAAEEERAVYVGYSDGRILQDTGYARYGAGSRWIDWGVQTHQGLEYGEPNRLLMLAGCIGLLLLAISAPVMWWKRRPAGRIAAPPRVRPQAATRGLLVIMLAGGALFPLTGLTMVAALLLDMAVRRTGTGRLEAAAA
ncbi:PepSY domain-containing protein [Sphingomonas sp. AP4-R1]|uniref:PepSY-associated TM helix domain-containing protein n=1 Tax=Sphingomonas sp. AP4-R1 TaxID=2735134 RepID=UPI00149379BD|nr:PepSY domain-containing protein [Sphingomonas sp. AP4-R1]QJU57100.1 PepSY domain-containing protein [Sphingomonas sp. AP4-R1]